MRTTCAPVQIYIGLIPATSYHKSCACHLHMLQVLHIFVRVVSTGAWLAVVSIPVPQRFRFPLCAKRAWKRIRLHSDVLQSPQTLSSLRGTILFQIWDNSIACNATLLRLSPAQGLMERGHQAPKKDLALAYYYDHLWPMITLHPHPSSPSMLSYLWLWKERHQMKLET